jgi:hypothetical protein
VGIGLMPCFMGDQEPVLRRLMPPVSSLRRDIWLVVHRDLQHNARVRAVLHFLAELIQRERSLISGEGLPPSAPEAAAVSRAPGAPGKRRARAS